MRLAGHHQSDHEVGGGVEGAVGVATAGAVYEADGGLADHGPILPVGTKVVVEIPDARSPAAARARPLITLWSME
ncbi:phage tail protein [Methylobacterium radiodurans]|uniref:Phage tail protein n=1 Tax=Methylobacterium radiodurans TaxID=2202828 RepID=A0A2U8VZL6_9HYPH|nr:phage tail protein [Methylobacterium radiodurans]